MIYKNFSDHITRKHGIVVEGWPLRVFDNPSAIGSQVELNVLLKAWETGATRFRKMPEDEHMAWLESRGDLGPVSSAVATAAVPPPQAHDQETILTAPANFPALHTSFNIVSLDSATPPQTNGGPLKKPRKTRSDKGKPRKRSSQVLGTNVFHTNTQ